MQVLARGTECDLALLSVENEEFWKGSEPLQFGRLPCLQVITVYDFFDGSSILMLIWMSIFPVISIYSCSQTKIQAARNCHKAACNRPCWKHINALKVSLRTRVIIHSLMQTGHTVIILFGAIPKKVLHTWGHIVFLMVQTYAGFSNRCGISSRRRYNICNKRRRITHWGAISWILWFFEYGIFNAPYFPA